jgi:hypothetical protein
MYSLNKNNMQLSLLSHMTKSIMFAAWMSSLTVTAYAMESVDEQTLSDTTGADGIAINVQTSQATFGSLYWQDGAGGTGSALALQNATLTSNANPTGSAAGTPLTATATLNTGSSGATPALSLNLNLQSALFVAPQIVICTGVTAGAPSGCGTSFGSLAIQTLNPTTFSLTTTNGLLNSAGTASIKLLLNNANIFFTQGTSGNYNQVVTSDIYANISATGRIWVDATDGFRFSTQNAAGTNIGSVTLTAPGTTAANGTWSGLGGLPINAGLQASVVMQNNGAAATPSTTLSANPNGIIAFGASGTLPTLDLTIRGTSAIGTGAGAEDNLGDVVGNAGIAARMTATLKTGNLTTVPDAFQLFVGAAGTGGYGIQLSDFVPFSNVTATTVNPAIDTGNIYLNLVKSTTTSLLMPVPAALTNGKGAENITTGANNFFTPADANNNYFPSTNTTQDTQTIPANNSLLLSVRGLSIQGVALNTAFYQNNVGICTGTTTCTGTGAVTGFAIMPVLYGLSGNLALSVNTATSLAYSLALAIVGNNGGAAGTGSGAAGTAGTLQESAIFLADTSSCLPASGATCAPQYIGLRDINLYLKSNGLITFGGNTTSSSINITLPKFLFVMSANFAAGYLPGADAAAGVPVANRFVNNKDTLVTFNVGLQSDATYFSNNQITITSSAATPSTLGLTADLTLAGTTGTTVTGAAPDQTAATGNFFRIVDSGGSAFGLDNITGRIQLATGSQLSIGSNSATLHSVININPDNIKGNELLTTLNFYPSTSAGGNGTAQTIGKMVLTGGTITSNLTLTPVSLP